MGYTLKSEKQDEGGGNMQVLMRERAHMSIVAQVQEEEDQKSVAELRSAWNNLLSQVQDDESEDGRIQDDDNENGCLQDNEEDEGDCIQDNEDVSEDGRLQDEEEEGDGLLDLLQEEEDGGDGARRQDDEGDDSILAFHQDDDDGAVMQEDEDGGGDVIEQGFFSRMFSGIHCFGGCVHNICN